MLINIIVIKANTGSIAPDNTPHKNDLFLVLLELCKGNDTTAPSGMFWIAIPIDNINALDNVILP